LALRPKAKAFIAARVNKSGNFKALFNSHVTGTLYGNEKKVIFTFQLLLNNFLS
jgi:hypothetical protein